MQKRYGRLTGRLEPKGSWRGTTPEAALGLNSLHAHDIAFTAVGAALRRISHGRGIGKGDCGSLLDIFSRSHCFLSLSLFFLSFFLLIVFRERERERASVCARASE